MNELVLRHLAAFEAQLAIMQTQIAAMRHAMQGADVPKARLATPARLERCDGVPDAHCALVNEDAKQFKGSFAAPHAADCKGCGSRLDL